MNGKELATWGLRDLARSVALAKGQHLDQDGVRVVTYDGPRLRIEFTPSIRGSSNPSVLQVWKIGDRAAAALVLSVIWDDAGSDMIVTYRTGSWENSLRLLAGLKAFKRDTTRPAMTAQL